MNADAKIGISTQIRGHRRKNWDNDANPWTQTQKLEYRRKSLGTDAKNEIKMQIRGRRRKN
uniref:hypothetical protein n=1 Tax=Bacillus timonensis TaxID=1033734 RepID=UPI0011DDCD56